MTLTRLSKKAEMTSALPLENVVDLIAQRNARMRTFWTKSMDGLRLPLQNCSLSRG
jgi:hypothetical protein